MKLNSKTIVPSALLTAILALLTATFPGTATAATTVLTGGTEGLYSTYDYIGGYIYGMDFKSITAQSINALGFWDSGANGLGTGISYTVGLWNTASGGLLASATISDADALDPTLIVEGGQWRYQTIPTVNLTSGATYTLGFYNPSNMSAADSLFLDYTSVTTALTVSKINTFRWSPSSILAFPSTTDIFDVTVAQVNAKLIPEPGSAGLVTLGSLMLLGRRRKTKG